MLDLGSELVEGAFEADTLRLNHFDGFVKNWVKPDEGEAERGEVRSPFGDNESCRGTVFPRLGGILGGEVVKSWVAYDTECEARLEMVVKRNFI